MKSIYIKNLNKAFSKAHNDARVAHILNKYRDEALVTTSCGTTSALLIHMISRIRPNHPIHFIDTGMLFPETLQYRDLLIEKYGVNIITHYPDQEKNRLSEEEKLWEKEPDKCCHYNKVGPLEKIKEGYEVWISGLIGYQNKYRSGLEFVQQKDDLFVFYPLIDWTPKMVNSYLDEYNIPRHPLEGYGFDSIGCTHCTAKGQGREGRWNGSGKTECGLHL